jgi:uncharacterized protein YbjT (DUF2867 family)
MNVVLFGSTGMIGAGALLECLADSRVDSVLAVNRRPSTITHPKLREVVRDDLFDCGPIQPAFANADACFFCLGVSSAGMDEASYHRVTYGLTMTIARSMVEVNDHLTFCFVSGAGTDSTERGRSMWARVKGKTENALLAMPFKAAFMFRPGFIQPLNGVRSRTPLYQAVYSVLGPLLPLIRRLAPRQVTTTVNLGRAMIRVSAVGYPKRILDPEDINRLAAGA